MFWRNGPAVDGTGCRTAPGVKVVCWLMGMLNNKWTLNRQGILRPPCTTLTEFVRRDDDDDDDEDCDDVDDDVGDHNLDMDE